MTCHWPAVRPPKSWVNWVLFFTCQVAALIEHMAWLACPTKPKFALQDLIPEGAPCSTTNPEFKDAGIWLKGQLKKRLRDVGEHMHGPFPALPVRQLHQAMQHVACASDQVRHWVYSLRLVMPSTEMTIAQCKCQIYVHRLKDGGTAASRGATAGAPLHSTPMLKG